MPLDLWKCVELCATVLLPPEMLRFPIEELKRLIVAFEPAALYLAISRRFAVHKLECFIEYTAFSWFEFHGRSPVIEKSNGARVERHLRVGGEAGLPA